MTGVKNRIEAHLGTDGVGRARTASRGRQTRLRRRLLWGAAGCVLLGMVALAARPDPLDVETALVTRGPLEVVIEEQGVTHVRDRYLVAAPVAGRLLRVSLRAGDMVATGQTVARILPAPSDRRAGAQAEEAVRSARAAVSAAGSRLAEARARRLQATRERRRLDVLAEAGAVSEGTRERAVLAETVATREVEAAAAAVVGNRALQRQAEASLIGLDPASAAAPVEVSAPTAGRVLNVPEPSERVVAAGAPLVEIGDARSLEAVIEVLTEDAVRLAAGTPVRLSGWGGPGPLAGRVRMVEPGGYTRVSALGVEEQRVRVIADISTAPAALGDGYRVVAALVTWRSPGVVRAPLSALFRQGEGWRVFVVEKGRARLRPVEIGHQGAEQAEVVRGLRQDEQLVVYPASELRDRARVRVVAR